MGLFKSFHICVEKEREREREQEKSRRRIREKTKNKTKNCIKKRKPGKNKLNSVKKKEA